MIEEMTVGCRSKKQKEKSNNFFKFPNFPSQNGALDTSLAINYENYVYIDSEFWRNFISSGEELKTICQFNSEKEVITKTIGAES